MDFICPTCKTTLEATPARYLCPTCETQYPVRDAIPDFWPQAGDYYWGEVPEPIAWQATELLRGEGFDAAVRYISSHNPDMAAYLTEDKRIDWLFHCLDDLTLDSCLDLGSGWGSLSVRLSHFFRHVWSLDGTWPRLRFQQAYAERRGARNLRLVRGNLFPLPFPDQSFDLVVANGVLEWVGLVNLDRPVTELQTAFLQEIHRVLKPNGVLYIGVENRFGFGNFAGSRDHSGLPYSALLPRRLASLAVRWFRRPYPDDTTVYRTASRWRDYRTYTYSLRGYRQLLRRAGFAAISFAWAWPSYNLPWLSGNVENSRALALFSISCGPAPWSIFPAAIGGNVCCAGALPFPPAPGLRLRCAGSSPAFSSSPAAKHLSRLRFPICKSAVFISSLPLPRPMGAN